MIRRYKTDSGEIIKLWYGTINKGMIINDKGNEIGQVRNVSRRGTPEECFLYDGKLYKYDEFESYTVPELNQMLEDRLTSYICKYVSDDDILATLINEKDKVGVLMYTNKSSNSEDMVVMRPVVDNFGVQNWENEIRFEHRDKESGEVHGCVYMFSDFTKYIRDMTFKIIEL